MKNTTVTERELPEIVRHRIDETLASLPDSRRPANPSRLRNRMVLSAVLASSVACLMIVGFTVPSFAEVLREAPVIGSVFKRVGDATLQSAHEKGIVTEINQSATDQGYEVNITEVLFDGSQLSIGYVLSSDKELPEQTNPHPSIEINGERLGTYGSSGSGDRIDAYSYAGLVYVFPAATLPESFDFGLTFRQFGDIKGKWAFTFPVKKQTAGNKVIMPMQAKTYGDTTILIEKVSFAATATEIVGRTIQPSAKGEAGLVEFEVVDDKGNRLEGISYTGNGDWFKGLFASVTDMPQSITIRPVRRHQTQFDPATMKGLEITIPVEQTERLWWK